MTNRFIFLPIASDDGNSEGLYDLDTRTLYAINREAQLMAIIVIGERSESFSGLPAVSLWNGLCVRGGFSEKQINLDKESDDDPKNNDDTRSFSDGSDLF